MTKQQILDEITRLYNDSPKNFITAEAAITPDLVGMKIFDAPIVSFGAADDPLFASFKDPAIIGPWFKTPEEWMPGAKSVAALFFPFTEAVRESNRRMTDGPSAPWLHGRIEGQMFLTDFANRLRERMTALGLGACTPMTDTRFMSTVGKNDFTDYNCPDADKFSSNWSERHAAYVCGLGTFGLHKSFITERGTAGRFTSIILDLPLEADARPYTGVYDYCIRCGACIARCKAGAICMESGKDHMTCAKWVAETSKKHAPRFGCGLCETGVPCESCNPAKKA